MNCWIKGAEDTDFSIHNIPFGIFSAEGRSPRIGTAIGDQVMDLKVAAILSIFDELAIPLPIWEEDTLNNFIGLGKAVTSRARQIIQEELCNEESVLRSNDQLFVPMSECTMHMPVQVGDYTDFYSSIEHATNVGKLFRDPENALLPNWKHLPVGYHGRASSIIVSGQDIIRPKGQTKPPEGAPVFGPSKRLDYELEMGFIIGKNSNLGSGVPVNDAEDYIFGKVIFNDWSARDIQKWEYVPLGPFLGKNFASSISPWVVTLDALEPFRTHGPLQDPAVLPYLQYDGQRNFDIKLEVGITPDGGQENIVCRSNFKYMYWNMSQQLAHHTVNGCNVKVGDMMASGTISGKDENSFGSMLELSWAGKKPVTLNDGSTRSFLADGDTVTMRAHCQQGNIRVGFGEVRAQIKPAINA